MRDVGLALLDGRTEEMPAVRLVALEDLPTEVMAAVEPPTRPLGIPTSPAMPMLRPYPRVTYPPPVPGRADAMTTVLPAMVRA